MSPHQVLAYHATRLTDRERERVLHVEGLQRLSPELMRRRLDEASAEGLLTLEEAEVLWQGRRAHERAAERLGMVWVFPDLDELRRHPTAAWPLLERWGGEGINFSEAGNALSARLSTIGRPSIVVVDLAGLGFTRAQLSADTCLEIDIPADHVVAVWQPGDLEYDDLGDLPR